MSFVRHFPHPTQEEQLRFRGKWERVQQAHREAGKFEIEELRNKSQEETAREFFELCALVQLLEEGHVQS